MNREKASDIARIISKELGQDGPAFAATQLAGASSANDPTGVSLWTEVVQVLEEYDRESPAEAQGRDSSELWRAMQKVELCRHRAMKLESTADNVAEPLRKDVLELAMQWRDLAFQVELLASRKGFGKS